MLTCEQENTELQGVSSSSQVRFKEPLLFDTPLQPENRWLSVGNLRYQPVPVDV